MSLLDELSARGLLAETTDRTGLAELLAKQSVSLYAGYDPTSSSLHVGNLVPTILLKRFQLAGHRPIVVVGGATGMIGDPSGKSAERNLLDDATLQTNVAGIRAQLARLMDLDGPHGALLVNNHDWMKSVGFLEFLRDTGKFLTVNYMLAKDSVKSRLDGDNGISWTEFSYMLLQAYDFVKLQELHDCRLQVGGSDQYGNITAGTELARKLGRPQLYGMVAPLLLDSSGQKMGKTSTGERIWLDPERTSPYAFYQYWLNRPDEEMEKLLLMFSLQSVEEIRATLDLHKQEPGKRQAQRALAQAMTAWVHGEPAIAIVEAAAKVMFGGDLAGVTEETLAALSGTVPTIEIPRSELEAGIGIVDLLARSVADSKGAARRLVAQGGAYVNNLKIADEKATITTANLATATMMVVRGGKKDYRLIKVT